MLQHISVLPPRPGSSSSTAGRLPIPITCEPCAPVLAGGQFSPHEGGRIRLCSDRLHSRQHASDVLTHELVHAWDDRHFDMDWKNVRHIACTEVSHRFTSRSSSSFFFFAKLIHLGLLPAQIRANALSGDCRWTRELDRHIWSFAGQRQMCARRRAALSLSQHPSLRDRFADEGSAREAAGKVIDEVWESCWNDSRPFDEIY